MGLDMGEDFCHASKAAKRGYIDKLRRRLEKLGSKTPEEQEIELEFDNERKLATIRIRSGARNAFSGKMISQLTDVMDQLELWAEKSDGRGLIICGHGGTFCSGSDLVSVREVLSQEDGLHLAQVMQYNLMRIQQLPAVSVAFMEGYALGGGAEIAVAADMRLMSSSASIGFVHSKNGICCGWGGGGTRLVELVGPSRACDLLSSGRTVAAKEALAMGLCNAIADTKDEAIEYLAKRTIAPKETISALKAVINGCRLLPMLESLREEAELFASTWGQSAHRKALESNTKHNKGAAGTKEAGK